MTESSTPAFQAELSRLRKQLPACLSKDRHRLSRQLHRLTKLSSDKQTSGMQKLEDALLESMLLKQQRVANVPEISYPPLPVSENQVEIAKAITEHQVVIIAGETGSGKTTQIPKICLDLGRGIDGMIGHTQPRRLAARSVADRIAEELKSPLGQHVGYKVRFTDNVSDTSYIKLMTDGILLAEIQRDRFLNQYDTLIIDEAHERSLNIDFILGYLKQLLPKRPDLKLIITSATIDPERFSKHFNDAPIIQVSGRTYPVEMRYRPFDDPAEDKDQTQAIIDAVDELSREGRGDILVFLSGEREIRDTADALNRQQYRHTEILPLYARLSAAEQQKIFHPHGARRIVLATNVAETSLTVPGIKYVIDPGMARISRYSVRSKVQRLPIEPISQASANQRAGRCGRVSEGICIRLYSEQDYLSRPEFTDPEILRTNLASVILQMLALGLGDIEAFPFVQAPDTRAVNDGFRLLEELGAVDGRGRDVSMTRLGREIARLPVDPRYARMVVAAAQQDCAREVMIIAAALSIQDPRERPQEKRQAADEKHQQFTDKESDFISYVNLWNTLREQQKALSNSQFRKWCQQHFINYLRVREWQDIVSQLKQSLVELDYRLNTQVPDYQAIHSALLTGLLSHLGFKDKEREYLGARNSRFMIFPGSQLSKQQPKWVMAAELVETSRLFARDVAKIDPVWVEPIAGHLIKKEHSEPHWSKRQGSVMAFEKVTLYGLVLVSQRRVNYGNIDPIVSREIFIREALVNGETKLNESFLRHNQKAVADVEALEDKSRRRDILVDEQVLVDFYLQKLPEHVVGEASFKKWWQKQDKADNPLHFDPNALLKQQAAGVNELNYPKYWHQDGLTLPLHYKFDIHADDDGVSLHIPLPVLNQLQFVEFDWLVPGLRHELIVTLIKGLPKRLRRNFVPAPDYAEACLQDIQSRDKKDQPVTLIDALSQKLFRMTGVRVEADDWNSVELPPHLRFNFKVVDGDQKLLAQGRDLFSLQQQLQGKVEKTLAKAATPELEQTGLTQWSFGALPKAFSSKRAGFEVKAFPALVAEEKQGSVAIKLFDQPHLAEFAQRKGLRTLIKVNMPSPVKYLHEKLPNKAKLGLYFNPFGQVKALIEDCIDAGVDALIDSFIEDGANAIRDEQAFLKALDHVRANINEQVLDIAKKVESGLTTAHEIKKKMKGNVPLTMINAIGDIKQQLDTLVFPGFVSELGVGRLGDWQRYIQGIAKRMEKLPIDPNKDRLHQLNLEKVQQAYQSYLNKIPKGQPVPVALQEVRWMLEELRISFFAQQLGTSMPISAKRILNHLEQL